MNHHMQARLRTLATLAGICSVLALAPASAEAGRKIKIKHGTLAPEGSPWHAAMQRLGKRWKKVSKGQVRMKIYPGGIAGDEGDMLRKIHIGQLQSATLTSVGLGRISRSTVALQIPMMFQSYEELDYVRNKISPRLTSELEKAGFIVLNWGDAGWVHFFSKDPGTDPADFRKWKMFMWAGDPESEQAFKAAGFRPVPMSSTDVMSGLQSGLIDWFGTTPLFALSSQWFGLTKHMVAIKWSPLNGATIISKKAWEKIPAEMRPALLKIGQEEGARVRAEVRGLGDKALKAMKDRGLNIVEPNAETIAKWQAAAQMAYPAIRGKVVPADLFDEVKGHVAAYRKKNSH